MLFRRRLFFSQSCGCCSSLPVLICPPVAAPAAARPCLTCLSSSVPCRRHSLVPACPHLSACCYSACCSCLPDVPVLICPVPPPQPRPCLSSSVRLLLLRLLLVPARRACPHLSRAAATVSSLPVLICPPVAAPAAARACLTCLSSSVPCRRHSLVPACPHLSACCYSACCSCLPDVPVLICPVPPPQPRPCLSSSVRLLLLRLPLVPA